ncbi:MAG: flagellar protein [Lachnospiraceae bacterium]|nr:flagellar protein [Lachnospiraceae bacterium]
MKITNGQFLSIEQLQDQYLNQTKKTQEIGKNQVSFKEILEQTAEKAEVVDLKFSKHAANRLADRKIELTDSQLERLSEGTAKAGEKGIKESLVLMDELAFIVNIPNHTVITAMSQTETDENVYTNIDGAVII